MAMNEFHQVSTDVDWLRIRLRPLLEGRAVILTLLNETGTGKRKNPLVTITPGDHLGFARKSVVVSVINLGSCIVEINCNQISGLVQAGIPSKFARILLTTLQLTYREVEHGNRTKARRTGKKRSSSTYIWQSTRKRTITTVKADAIQYSERLSRRGSAGEDAGGTRKGRRPRRTE